MDVQLDALPAVILAGGLGTRIREQSEYLPKPMIEIGGKPIIWHIMRNLSVFGIKEFIILTGYKSEILKIYFENFNLLNSHVTFDFKNDTKYFHQNTQDELSWKVTLIDTGINTNTGGRISLAKDFIGKRRFLCTYGDGLSNVDVRALFDNHLKSKKTVTVTAVNPVGRFGVLEISHTNTVTSFREKEMSKDWVNGGFMVMEENIFRYLNSESILEREPLQELAQIGELNAFKHSGFWQPMDTYREYLELNKQWTEQNAPWKNW